MKSKDCAAVAQTWNDHTASNGNRHAQFEKGMMKTKNQPKKSRWTRHKSHSIRVSSSSLFRFHFRLFFRRCVLRCRSFARLISLLVSVIFFCCLLFSLFHSSFVFSLCRFFAIIDVCVRLCDQSASVCSYEQQRNKEVRGRDRSRCHHVIQLLSFCWLVALSWNASVTSFVSIHFKPATAKIYEKWSKQNSTEFVQIETFSQCLFHIKRIIGLKCSNVNERTKNVRRSAKKQWNKIPSNNRNRQHDDIVRRTLCDKIPVTDEKEQKKWKEKNHREAIK